MTNTVDDLNYMNNDLSSQSKECFAGTVVNYSQDNDHTFTFRCHNHVAMMLNVVTDKIIRFRFSTDGYFENDFTYAIDKENTLQASVEFIEFKEKSDHYRITTENLICIVQKEGLKTRILDRSGNVLNEDEKGFHWLYDDNTGNDIVIMSKKIQSSEHFYGLGDKSCDFNLRGKRLENWGSDKYAYGKDTDPLYKNIPFFTGLHKKTSYGIFFDNTFRSYFDFGAERSNVSSFWAQGGEMNYYFIYGPEMMDVSTTYTNLTGTPELPPLWALGFHQCKWSYYPESKVREVTDGFRKHQIPCDAIYLDIDYMDGFRCFTWNKEYFPEPQKMVKELADNGFKTVVIIDPGIKIDRNYWVYQQAFKKGYFCKRPDGKLMKGSVWPGLCNFPDFTKPEVRDWWEDLFEGLIAEDGIKGVWNDMNEPAVFETGTFPDDVMHDYDGNPGSHRKGHNVYGMQMARATYEGVKKFAYPNRPFVITRSAYSGIQRYTSAWTGDNVASWEHLQIADTQCQRLSVSGLSFVGSDIGGFIETPNGELFIRWIQLGIFHPFCRVHSSGDHGDQEPWSFGEKYTALAKKFIELRYQLLPYIYTAFWQYVTTGKPMLRPLSFLDQHDSETYYRQEEFGLGDHLLACPVTQESADGRWLYLPSGSWYYYWTDEIFNGSQEVWADADLERVPMYVKAGAVLPLYPVMQYVGEKEVEELTLHVYYANKNSEVSYLYEDKGDGYGYEENEKCVNTFTFEGSPYHATLHQHKEGQFKTSYTTYKLVLHGFPSSITSYKIDDEEEKAFETYEKNQIGKKLAILTVSQNFQKIDFIKHDAE